MLVRNRFSILGLALVTLTAGAAGAQNPQVNGRTRMPTTGFTGIPFNNANVPSVVFGLPANPPTNSVPVSTYNSLATGTGSQGTGTIGNQGNSPYNGFSNPYANPYTNPYGNPFSNSPYSSPLYNPAASGALSSPFNNPFASTPFNNPAFNTPSYNQALNNPYNYFGMANPYLNPMMNPYYSPYGGYGSPPPYGYPYAGGFGTPYPTGPAPFGNGTNNPSFNFSGSPFNTQGGLNPAFNNMLNQITMPQ